MAHVGSQWSVGRSLELCRRKLRPAETVVASYAQLQMGMANGNMYWQTNVAARLDQQSGGWQGAVLRDDAIEVDWSILKHHSEKLEKGGVSAATARLQGDPAVAIGWPLP